MIENNNRAIRDELATILATRQLDTLKTLSHLAEKRLSLSRFGDGELRMMLNSRSSTQFQESRPRLMRALRELFSEHLTASEWMLAVPPILEAPVWAHFYRDYGPSLHSLYKEQSLLGNSFCSRGLLFALHGEAGVSAWSELWAGERALVVTGRGSRFEVVPQLFGSLKSMDFLFASPVNAYSSLPELVGHVTSSSNFSIVLIALGPAGSVLAAELAKRGVWSIDIGHLSNSYQAVFEKGPRPGELSLVNELNLKGGRLGPH